MAEIHNLPAKRPSTSGNGSQPGSPAAVSQIVAHLTGCLALVRPAGMTDGEAEEWLSAAAQTLAVYPVPSVASACGSARRECTHYSQIVPHVAKACETARAEHLRISEFTERPMALPRPQMTQEDFERIVAERGRALSVALDMGTILRTERGFERA